MNGSDDRREPVLDGIRGVAILLVVFHHVIIYSSMTRHGLSDQLLHAVGSATWFGVDLFFVLSGFLITGILYDTRSSAKYFTSFYARRVLRIFPLYYGFLALTFVLLPMWLPEAAAARLSNGEIWYWTYTSNIQVALSGWQEPLHLGHFWSLAVEEQFYLVWPFVIVSLSRRRLMVVTALCFMTAVGLRVTAPFGLSPLGAYVLMPMRMDSLAAGAFLALAVRGSEGRRLVRTWSPLVFVCGGLTLLMLFYWRRGLNEEDLVIRTAGYSVLAITFAALIGGARDASPRGWVHKGLCWSPLLVLGQYSYGLYVFHQPVAILARDYGWRADMLPTMWGSQAPGVAGFGVIVLTISIICALASWHLWELKFLRLKRYFRYRTVVSFAPQDSNEPVGRVLT